MSCEAYLRAKHQNFDVQRFLQTFGLEDLESAISLFKEAIGNNARSKPSPATRWAKDIQKSNFSIVSSTTALDYFLRQTKRRAQQLQELQILSDKLQDASARARVTESLDETSNVTAQDTVPSGDDQHENEQELQEIKAHGRKTYGEYSQGLARLHPFLFR
ncbi:hypothetical protein DFQ30_001697 [Apophysomyces sp. BC1015]|nr:hypothetical protein DFQ30_001697 [Apophysomyces sp. BC1015]